MPGLVKLDWEGTLAFVSIANPRKLNAMNRAMWRELRNVFEAIQESPDVRCVLVRGVEGSFCAGGDIAEYPKFRFTEAGLSAFHEKDVWGGLEAMLQCDVPIVAQIEGPCMGAGMEIASCCDIRIAGEGATFGAPIARLGFPMAPREAQLVMTAAGEATAREMLLEAAVLGAAEMKARGFLNRVTPGFGVSEAALKSALRISELAPQAARLNKQTLRVLKANPAAAVALAPTAYTYAASAEHKEGIEAFIGKRPPDFQHSAQEEP